MATDKKKPDLDETLESLANDDEVQSEEELAALEDLASRVEEPGLQDRILDRYQAFGRELLSDSLPDKLDPRVAKNLEPVLGDVSNVRVHTGKVATEAARAMDARAFAIGDSDVFIDEGEYRPHTAEGAGLLAHEVAHTRDAATGFALSSRGSATGQSAREAFAHAVEESYIEAEEAGSQMAPPADSGKPQKPQVDMLELEDRVFELLQERAKAAGRRSGR